MISAKWARSFPNSANNFDLLLTNPESLDFERLKELLAGIRAEKHRGNIRLTSRAAQEFQRWFDDPVTPLKSEAYVLLSNWFLTESGDRTSIVASRCENLWDALFPCRPAGRLSSPAPGRNHLMLPAEFGRLWRRIVYAQGGELPRGDDDPQESLARMKTRVGDASDFHSYVWLLVPEVGRFDRFLQRREKLVNVRCKMIGCPELDVDAVLEVGVFFDLLPRGPGCVVRGQSIRVRNTQRGEQTDPCHRHQRPADFLLLCPVPRLDNRAVTPEAKRLAFTISGHTRRTSDRQ
jgi:hypothetical protein